MKKTWEVTVKGKVHTIEYEIGAVAKNTVDGKEEKVKSQNGCLRAGSTAWRHPFCLEKMVRAGVSWK